MSVQPVLDLEVDTCDVWTDGRPCGGWPVTHAVTGFDCGHAKRVCGGCVPRVEAAVTPTGGPWKCHVCGVWTWPSRVRLEASGWRTARKEWGQ